MPYISWIFSTCILIVHAHLRVHPGPSPTNVGSGITTSRGKAPIPRFCEASGADGDEESWLICSVASDAAIGPPEDRNTSGSAQRRNDGARLQTWTDASKGRRITTSERSLQTAELRVADLDSVLASSENLPEGLPLQRLDENSKSYLSTIKDKFLQVLTSDPKKGQRLWVHEYGFGAMLHAIFKDVLKTKSDSVRLPYDVGCPTAIPHCWIADCKNKDLSCFSSI